MANLIQPKGSTGRILTIDFISKIFNITSDKVAIIKTGVNLTGITVVYDPQSEFMFYNTTSGTVTQYQVTNESLSVQTQSGSATLLRAKNGTSDGFITVRSFGAKADGVTNDSAAFIAADLKAKELGYILDGEGLTYAVGSSFRMDCGRFRNFKIVPTSGFTGAAPTFLINPITGSITHESIDISGFLAAGTKIFNGSVYTGVGEVIFSGYCRYNRNGNLARSALTENFNPSTSFVTNVADGSIFVVDGLVEIGDGRYRILSISGNTLTFYNNGTQADQLKTSGQRNQIYAGNWVTRNRGEDNNGIRIGDGKITWNVKVLGKIQACDNGWTGFYIRNNDAAYGGVLSLQGIEASRNGFIGIGLGLTNVGSIRDCVSQYNGNNGIDTFESKKTFLITGNISTNNGVDNIFAGGNGQCAQVVDNVATDANRIGILISGRTTSIVDAIVSGNNCLGSQYRSIGFTAVDTGVINDNSVGGANNYSIYVEGKYDAAGGITSLANPSKVTIQNNDMYASVTGDTGGNLRNNPNFPAGTVDIINNNTFSRMPVSVFTSVNYYGCKFDPECLLGGASSYSVAANGTISVSIVVRRPNNTTVTDAASVRPVNMSISTASDGTDQGTVTSATKTISAIAELLNTATTNGKIIAVPSQGNISYNFQLSSAGVRYLLVECGGFKKLITLTWT